MKSILVIAFIGFLLVFFIFGEIEARHLSGKGQNTPNKIHLTAKIKYPIEPYSHTLGQTNTTSLENDIPRCYLPEGCGKTIRGNK